MTQENRSTALMLPDEATFKRDLQAINNFQAIVHAQMRPGLDYGIIPGTTKPTLFKPGAEKITKLLGLSDQYIVLEKVENWDKPLFFYTVKCSLVYINTGDLISEGLGSCNSREGRYRWRESKRKCPECGAEAIIKGKAEYGGGWLCFKKQGGCGYKWDDGAEVIEKQTIGRIENDDIFSLVNTFLKMAEKRALVDAALHAGRLSEVFTQDIEDIGSMAGDFPAGEIIDGNAKPATQSESPNPGTSADPSTIKTAPGKDKAAVDLTALTFANAGEFYQACLTHFKLQKTQVDNETAMYDKSVPKQRTAAWMAIVTTYNRK